MSHHYIVSGIPYLVTSGRPIYKVPPIGNKTNPNKEKNGTVHNLIQIQLTSKKEINPMVSIIITPPQEVEIEPVESVQPELEAPIDIVRIQKEIRKPRQSHKIKITFTKP